MENTALYRLEAYFLDSPEDDRDPIQSLWIEGDSLAPFIVTPLRNCVRAFECAFPTSPAQGMAEVSSSDCVADIGCGDGRVVIAAAALFGCTGLGVDLDAYAVSRAQAALEHWRPEVGERVRIAEGDATQADFSGATVLFCSMLPGGVAALAPVLHAALERGARVVCLHFPLDGEECAAADADHRLFLYRKARRGTFDNRP